MSEVMIGDCRIWYEVDGSGEHMLQIGGAGFGHENFNAVSEAMKANFTVIDFDLRGYGLSDRPEQHYDFDVWADDVAEVIRAVGVDRTHVHGTSMGGMVAIRLAAKYPELIDTLILSCTAAKSDHMMRARWKVWIELAKAYGTDSEILAEEISTQALSRRFLDGPTGDDTVTAIQGVLERNAPVFTFNAACQAMIDMDLTEDLKAIQAPTMVVAGDEDILTPLTQGPQGLGSAKIVELIPNAELCLMQGIAHSNLLEAPEASVNDIVAFVSRVAAAAR